MVEASRHRRVRSRSVDPAIAPRSSSPPIPESNLPVITHESSFRSNEIALERGQTNFPELMKLQNMSEILKQQIVYGKASLDDSDKSSSGGSVFVCSSPSTFKELASINTVPGPAEEKLNILTDAYQSLFTSYQVLYNKRITAQESKAETYEQAFQQIVKEYTEYVEENDEKICQLSEELEVTKLELKRKTAQIASVQKLSAEYEQRIIAQHSVLKSKSVTIQAVLEITCATIRKLSETNERLNNSIKTINAYECLTGVHLVPMVDKAEYSETVDNIAKQLNNSDSFIVETDLMNEKFKELTTQRATGNAIKKMQKEVEKRKERYEKKCEQNNSTAKLVAFVRYCSKLDSTTNTYLSNINAYAGNSSNNTKVAQPNNNNSNKYAINERELSMSSLINPNETYFRKSLIGSRLKKSISLGRSRLRTGIEERPRLLSTQLVGKESFYAGQVNDSDIFLRNHAFSKDGIPAGAGQQQHILDQRAIAGSVSSSMTNYPSAEDNINRFIQIFSRAFKEGEDAFPIEKAFSLMKNEKLAEGVAAFSPAVKSLISAFQYVSRDSTIDFSLSNNGGFIKLYPNKRNIAHNSNNKQASMSALLLTNEELLLQKNPEKLKLVSLDKISESLSNCSFVFALRETSLDPNDMARPDCNGFVGRLIFDVHGKVSIDCLRIPKDVDEVSKQNFEDGIQNESPIVASCVFKQMLKSTLDFFSANQLTGQERNHNQSDDENNSSSDEYEYSV